jgi:hypothetical protein
MTCALKLGPVIVLLWGVFLFAQTSSSTERKSEHPAGGVEAGPAVMDAADDLPAPIGIGSLEVLGDTQGVDFGPYLQSVKRVPLISAGAAPFVVLARRPTA